MSRGLRKSGSCTPYFALSRAPWHLFSRFPTPPPPLRVRQVNEDCDDGRRIQASQDHGRASWGLSCRHPALAPHQRVVDRRTVGRFKGCGPPTQRKIALGEWNSISVSWIRFPSKAILSVFVHSSPYLVLSMWTLAPFVFSLSSLGSTIATDAPLHGAVARQNARWKVGQVVQTSSGAVQGHASRNFSHVSEYLGVPYAQPPVGNLRFQPPVKFSGTKAINASSYVQPPPRPPQSICPSTTPLRCNRVCYT